ncbi:uncharacterized protein LOC143212451 [Lasioglossum baleicum]|uniref:uncharacterized protein LOC143212451 n=1 Tax=Lasioglossum baleicum TaxID=434251 RepID=UPI003FCED50C
MPSFLGRFLGLTFRTELLIMNILGLINSTLDWSPLKWTNKLEQIWNFSMPQKSLIVDTIGEDTIKTILSWIVITRIVIAHVYTFTYLSNIYPIITWSRPNLLLPWLILSFFKNVVLEIIVIVIGLLLWYGNPFSLVVFLEFIFVKLIPLILASYNWYSNSCLFLQLRQTEKMKKLRRSMKSDSNLLTNQLYVKIDDPKYRTGSLTTLFSYDSYETYNPNLTPGQNAKKLLGITDQDVADARARIKQTEADKKLTELDDDINCGLRIGSKGYIIGSSIYESDLFRQKVSQISAIYQPENDAENKRDTSGNPKNNPEIRSQENKNKEAAEGLEEKRNLVEQYKAPEIVQVQERLKGLATFDDLEKIEEEEDVVVTNLTREVLATKKREGTDLVESPRMKQQRTRSPTDEEDIGAVTRPKGELDPTGGESVKSVERSSSPVKLQALFNCCCTVGESALKESHANSVKTTDARTSTPRERSEVDNEETQAEENSKKPFDQPYTYAYNVVTDVKTDFTMNSGFPLMEKLLKNDLEILKSIKVEEQTSKKRRFDDAAVPKIPKDDRSNMFLDDYDNHRNPSSTDLQNISEIVKDLVGVSTKTTSTLKTEEYGSDRRQTGIGGAEDGTTRLQNATWRLEEDIMKVFDGLYQNDFANNSELQCALQQMEKKKWNPFSGQTNLETLMTTTFPERNPPSLIDFWRPEEMCDSSESTSRRSVLTEDRQLPKIGTDISDGLPPRPLKAEDIPKPVVVSVTRDMGTQTEYHTAPKHSNSNEAGHLMDAKPRSKYFRRRKRPQDQSDSASHVTGAKPVSTKRDYTLVSRMRSKSPMLSKSSLNDRIRLNASKSFANKHDCECKMQNLGGKCTPSAGSSFDKREEECKVSGKQKVDSLATLPLAQAIRKPEANPLHSRRKPPVYPKETHKDSWWRTPSGRIDSLESKKLVDRQSINSSRTSSSKTSSSRTSSSRNRPKRPTEDQAARELRALKAYNEITLLKVKKELDVQKNLGRVIPNRDFRSSYKRVASRNDLGKENLSANTANETGYSSRSNKLTLNAAGRSTTMSNERYASKSSKVVKTSNEQKNFDRLKVAASRLQQLNADLTDIRRMAEEMVPSETSDVKLESAVTGRDLDRSKAKEDVRVLLAASSVEAVAGRLGSRIEKPAAIDCVDQDEASRVDVEDLELGKKELLTLLNKSAEEDAAPTLSTSSVDLEAMVIESSHEEEIHDLPVVEEEVVLEETSDGTAGSLKVVREEVIEQSARTLVDSRSDRRDEEDNRGNRSLDPTSLTWRERDSNADLWGDIVDNVTPAKLHNYYSSKLMDSLLHDSKMEEFSSFSEQVDRFSTNVSAIREARDLGGQAPRPLIICTAAMDHGNIPANLEIEPGIEEIEDGQGFRLNEEQLHDILSSVTEVLRNLNIDENAENRSRTKDATLERIVEIFDDVLEDGFQDIGEIPKFIKEDIFTDIKFPIMISAAAINPGLKTLNVFPLQLRLDRRDAEFVEPMETDLDGLTVITEENEEDAEEAGARGVQVSNFEKFALKLVSSCKFFESTRVDEFEDATEVEIEEDYHSVIDETFSSSMECATFVEVPGYVKEVAGNTLKVDLNKTYDILNGLDSNEDTDESSLRREEFDGNGGEDSVYDSGTVDEAGMSIETEKVWKVYLFTDDQRGMVDAGIEQVIEKLKESVQIEIGGSVDVGETESRRVQDDQIGVRDIERVTEVAKIENAMGSEKFGKHFVDENTKEETEIRDSSQPEETVFHQVEEAEDGNYRNIIVGRNEDGVERGRRVDKHAQEEDVGNEALGEDVRVEEVEGSTSDVDVMNITEIDRPCTSIVKVKEREENVRVLDPVRESNTILVEERGEGFVRQIEVPSLEIVPEETEVVETREEISLKTIFMFWLLVFYFYIRHFYRWMCSLTQVSRTTSTLRPFDVHTVVTSTSTLIEHVALLNRIQEGLVEEDEQTLETSVNSETVNISRAIEERLRVVLDLTTERSVSRNSEFGLEELAEELRRETVDLGLSSSEYLAEETRSEEPEEINISSELREHEQEVILVTKLQELSPKNDNDQQLDVPDATVKIDTDIEEVQDAIRNREMSSSSIDDDKVEISSGAGPSSMDKLSESVEITREENSSPVQFETTLEDMDSFYSLYTRPSVTTNTVSYTGLDGDNMEEFSIASNTSDEPAQT